ncbi:MULTISPECIES: sensor histidine kinase [Virgibacillus]|uniref:histidine kinase n=1 Tax=Virgibacillus dokdonensis TaxID=302167 RepID=A0A2K9J0M2_9BACI|nr:MULTISPECIES: HAMP domain-containing sensor histidine kinase [Virgibacillus]AUJ25512.1 Signal transduction histidine-protein kinase BaeS [Virgibacillus dokdonensis]NWO14383.1 HAMP domain-containing histidine kinase [Virgibacillus sp.]
MKLTLRTKIFIYLLIVSLCGVFLTSFSIFFGVENQFSSYLQISREEKTSFVEEEIIRTYQQTGSLVSEQANSMLHDQAMTENLFYTIYDRAGNAVADSTRMQHMMRGMGMHQQAEKVDYETSSHPIEVDGEKVGTMEVVYPVELVGEDFTFLKSIQKNILIAVIAIILLSILFSFLFSRRLSAGFTRLSTAVQQLKKHKRVDVPVKDLSIEMKQLGESFNELANSLAKEEQLRKQFTADFAHELRTPLATLRSQLEAYQDGIWEPTPERLQKSHHELMRLVRLVNELETLIAVENPQKKLNMSTLDAGELLRFMDSQFQPAFHKKGVVLRSYFPNKEIHFRADEDRVTQILTNLMNNALQYTPTGKTVKIFTEEKEDCICFMVMDEGIGIKKEDIPFLFERFYRGDKSRATKTGGIGIGLSIVKALVDAHHGTIDFNSEVGEGTTVTVCFPKKGKH